MLDHCVPGGAGAQSSVNAPPGEGREVAWVGEVLLGVWNYIFGGRRGGCVFPQRNHNPCAVFSLFFRDTLPGTIGV